MQDVKDDKYLKKLCNRIRKLRNDRFLSQLVLAVKMNNFVEQVGRTERGELNVNICTLKKIAEALDMDLKDLLDF